MKVKAGFIPGTISEYAVGDHATVADVLTTAGLDYANATITVDGVPSSLSQAVADGSRVLLTRNTKGN